MEFESALKRAEDGNINYETVLSLLKNSREEERMLQLFSAASEKRDSEIGRKLSITSHIHMVTECSIEPSCLYCSLSSTDLKRREQRYPISLKVLSRYVEYSIGKRVSSLVLVGGTRLEGLDREIREVVTKVRDHTDIDIAIDICPSINAETIKWLKKRDVSTIYSSLETINPQEFRTAKPGDSLSRRIDLMKTVEREGLNLGTIVMNGLGTDFDLLKSILYMRRYKNLSHFHISVFHPVIGTPWQGKDQASLIDSLRTLSIARFVFPSAHIGLAEVGVEAAAVPNFSEELKSGGGNVLAGILLYKYIRRDNIDIIRRFAGSLGFSIAPEIGT